MKVRFWILLIVSAMSGIVAACTQLAAAFPDIAWVFTVIATLMMPIANQLKEAVAKKQPAPGPIELPPAA